MKDFDLVGDLRQILEEFFPSGMVGTMVMGHHHTDPQSGVRCSTLPFGVLSNWDQVIWRLRCFLYKDQVLDLLLGLEPKKMPAAPVIQTQPYFTVCLQCISNLCSLGYRNAFLRRAKRIQCETTKRTFNTCQSFFKHKILGSQCLFLW